MSIAHLLILFFQGYIKDTISTQKQHQLICGSNQVVEFYRHSSLSVVLINPVPRAFQCPFSMLCCPEAVRALKLIYDASQQRFVPDSVWQRLRSIFLTVNSDQDVGTKNILLRKCHSFNRFLKCIHPSACSFRETTALFPSRSMCHSCSSFPVLRLLLSVIIVWTGVMSVVMSVVLNNHQQAVWNIWDHQGLTFWLKTVQMELWMSDFKCLSMPYQECSPYITANKTW